jgi:RNA polymerase sigma-70 factor (ECF subfamily)
MKISTTAAPQAQTELVERILEGDPQAFNSFVRSEHAMLFGATRQILEHQEDAEDTYYQALEKVWRKRGSFKKRSAFTTFVITIVKNAAIDLIDKRRRERVIFDYVPDTNARGRIKISWNSSVAPETPATEMERHELREQIFSAICLLSEEKREAFCLYELEGMDYQQIAERTGEKRGTIQSRIFYARQELRTRLAHLRN